MTSHVSIDGGRPPRRNAATQYLKPRVPNFSNSPRIGIVQIPPQKAKDANWGIPSGRVGVVENGANGTTPEKWSRPTRGWWTAKTAATPIKNDVPTNGTRRGVADILVFL